MKNRGQEPQEQLLIEAAQKDPSRFAELYENNFERVYAFIARRERNRTEAQDLTADVFHQALANLGRFQWRGAPFATWLLRIAANAVTDQMRRSVKRREHLALDDPGERESPSGLEELEEHTKLFRLVHGLPIDQRRVILLRFVEEKSICEIARELRRTEGAVKQLQFRALKHLRARMEDANG